VKPLRPAKVPALYKLAQHEACTAPDGWPEIARLTALSYTEPCHHHHHKLAMSEGRKTASTVVIALMRSTRFRFQNLSNSEICSYHDSTVILLVHLDLYEQRFVTRSTVLLFMTQSTPLTG